MATLQTLAATISDQVTEISRILDSKGLSQPQIGEAGINDFATIDYELRDARNALIRAAQDVVRLAQGPEDQVLSLAWSAADAANLSTIVRFDIASKVPSNGQIPAVDLAAAIGLEQGVLERIVRYAIGNGIFQEPEPAMFAHSAASALLGRSEHLRNIVSLSSDDMVRVISRQGETLQLQKDDPKNGPATAFNVAFPEYANVFEYFSKNPGVGQRYHKYLLGRIHTSRWSVEHLTSCWDWASIGTGTVVDVGGSSGHTCAALARICPNAKFIIEDVNPDALVQGRQLLGADPDVFRRTTFVIHDFFTQQPVEGDIYIFRHIFHDWSDEDTVKILTNLLPALKPGSRVLVSEGLIPDPPGRRTGCLDERLILLEDMFMLGVHAGRERSAADFDKLFHQASPSFKLKGVTGGRSGEFQSLLEFVYLP